MVNYKLLEAKGAPVSADKEYNRTPLMWAVRTKEADDQLPAESYVYKRKCRKKLISRTRGGGHLALSLYA
jgi:hypothetical protein